MDLNENDLQKLFKRGTEALYSLRCAFDSSCLSIDCPWLYDEVKQDDKIKEDEKSNVTIQLSLGF